MGGLGSRSCSACSPGTPSLTEAAASTLGDLIDGAWTRSGNEFLSRDFRFSDFKDAFAAATRLALLSEQQGHHPDFEIGWGYLKVTLTTHAAKGLTENDFIMAAKIDELIP